MHGRLAATALTMMLILLGSSCTMHDGGYMPMSPGTWSPMTFHSTAAAPKTVAIVDTRTGETVFEVDIPAGQQLSIEFFLDKHRHDKPEAPDYMMYTVHSLGSPIGHLDLRVDVPAPWNRRVDVFLRTMEAYTRPDPTRPVEPLSVPLPEGAVAHRPRVPTPAPILKAVSQPTDATHPDDAGTTQPDATDTPTELPAGDTVKAPEQSPADSPPAAPQTVDAPAETRDQQPEAAEPVSELPAVQPPAPAPPEAVGPAAATTDEPPAPKPEPTVPPTEVPPPPPVEPEPPAIAPHTAGPASSMTWTDTGHTRRVWVTDLRTGDRVFELDVPKGSDLILHFFDMWTPTNAANDVQSMHWQIVPAGQAIDVPAHHATVPVERFRRISEQGVEPPPAAAPAKQPVADDPPQADEPVVPPPVDLLDDAVEPPLNPS